MMKKASFSLSLGTVLAVGLTILLGACSAAPKRPKVAPPAASKSAPQGPAEQTAPRSDKPVSPARLPEVGKEDINGDVPPPQEKGGESEKEASTLLEEAMAAYQDAQADIERDDPDAALARLDEAYGLILKVSLPPESPLLQDKNDLRILIAQRIQQANVRRSAPPVSVNNSIPLVENKWVQRELESFQTREKADFLQSYKRSGLYREMIVEELRKAGLPERISWVPMIESSYKSRALSRARALGMWQFIRSTGYRFGLKQDKYVDERMDPVKSTRAAIRYLTELHTLFGDWTTALAAYNCGEAQVQRVIRAQRIEYLDNFWDVFNNLPFETARYVPRFIASLLIIENPEKYGFELPTPDPPLRVETVRIATPVKLASLAQSLGIEPLLLTAMNPELRHDSTPNYDYELRVPQGFAEKVAGALTALPQYVPPDVVAERYAVRRGDTLGEIARRYRTSVDAIARLNGLRSRTLIHPGQVLRIPVRGAAPAAAAESPPLKPGETVQYVVKSGDTLFQIAKQFGTTVDKIKTANNLVSDDLIVGQKLVIRSGRS